MPAIARPVCPTCQQSNAVAAEPGRSNECMRRIGASAGRIGKPANESDQSSRTDFVPLPRHCVAALPKL